MDVSDLEQELANDIAQFEHDPLGFARYAYPWKEGDLLGSEGPRVWQTDILEVIGKHLQNPESRFQPLQIAVSSGHGIGKSTLIAMITEWAKSTCVDCRVVITANTGTQLDTKTSPEVGKWFRLSINSHWWDVKQTSIRARDKEHEKSWRTDFIPWSKENPAAFAGTHNAGKRILVVFDEASEIDDIIWETVAGALSDADTEIIFLAFGNPTRNTGRFRECFGRFKHRWITRQIDSRSVEGTNKVQIQKDIEDFGEDSDFVRVRWRGEFPRSGSNQFIASDVVAAARKYQAAGYESLPKIISVDVARFGDDQTVIGYRQGRKSVILGKYRKLDTVQTAERVIEFWNREKPDGVVVDGDGIGAGVVDHLTHRGYNAAKGLFEFHGGATPRDESMYRNRRAEIWGAMRDWLGAGAEIPNDPELEQDLIGVQYCFSPKQQIQLERKEDMKKRGMNSPDCGDMLAMTFAVQLVAKKNLGRIVPPSKHGPWS